MNVLSHKVKNVIETNEEKDDVIVNYFVHNFKSVFGNIQFDDETLKYLNDIYFSFNFDEIFKRFYSLKINGNKLSEWIDSNEYKSKMNEIFKPFNSNQNEQEWDMFINTLKQQKVGLNLIKYNLLDPNLKESLSSFSVNLSELDLELRNIIKTGQNCNKISKMISKMSDLNSLSKKGILSTISNIFISPNIQEWVCNNCEYVNRSYKKEGKEILSIISCLVCGINIHDSFLLKLTKPDSNIINISSLNKLNKNKFKILLNKWENIIIKYSECNKNECISNQRLDLVLFIYEKWIKFDLNKNNDNIPFNWFVSNVLKYDIELIHSDLTHLLINHLKHTDYEPGKTELKDISFKCFDKDCMITNRCFNDRIKRETQKTQKQDYYIPETFNKNDITKDLLLKQYLDVIHSTVCHFFKTPNSQFNEDSFDDNDDDDDDDDDEKNEKEEEKEEKDVDIDIKPVRQNKDVLIFGYGVDMDYPYHKNLYSSLKDEVYPYLGSESWNVQLLKSKILLHSNSIIRYSDRTDNDYGIFKYENIKTSHLLSLSMYCNCTNLQFQFRKTFRMIDDDNDNILNVVQRHYAFHHWGRFLFEAVEYYGQNLETENRLVMHGLSVELYFDKFSTHFNVCLYN